jgi:hypothetical protein
VAGGFPGRRAAVRRYELHPIRGGDVRNPADYIAAGHRYLSAMTADLCARQPWKLLIAEDMQGDPS